MSPLGLVKPFTAEGEIKKRRIVAYGSGEGLVAEASAAQSLLGVSGIRGAVDGATVDVYLSDIQDVEVSEPISFGDYVTSDADGRGIVAAPGAGVTVEVVGRAVADSGGAGSYVQVRINPQQVTG